MNNDFEVAIITEQFYENDNILYNYDYDYCRLLTKVTNLQ